MKNEKKLKLDNQNITPLALVLSASAWSWSSCVRSCTVSVLVEAKQIGLHKDLQGTAVALHVSIIAFSSSSFLVPLRSASAQPSTNGFLGTDFEMGRVSAEAAKPG